MKKRAAWILLAIPALIFLIFIAQYAASPVLYTVKDDSVTSSHQNPEALKQISREQSETVLPLMSEILGSTGTLVLNIKLKDFDSAERDLKEYMERSRQLDRMVINLDMSETELAEFRRNNQKNVQSLEELLNDTRRFDELQSLEIRYRDENRPELLYSVMYEGETLRSRVAENFKGYQSRSDAMVNTSTKFELDTAAYEESVEDFEEIVAAIDAEQETRSTTTHAPATPYRLSIAVTPDHGVYRDRLLIAGNLTGRTIAGQNITLFIDSKTWTTTTTDDGGGYKAAFAIDRIRAGKHLVYAVYGSTYSDVVTFSVLPLDTALTLAVTEGTASGNRTFSGNLTAAGMPVAGAPVAITADGKAFLSATTNSAGSYALEGHLEAGTYRVRAVFDAVAFPLNASESETVLIEIAPSLLESPLLISAGILLLTALGAVWYVRRRRQPAPAPEEVSVAETEDEEAPAPVVVERPPVEEEENILATFARLAGEGSISDAVHALYLRLAGSIAVRHRIDGHAAMTPREFLAACRSISCIETLTRFIRRYEAVRYGGAVPDDSERQELVAWFEDLMKEEAGSD
ncbi:DUF4129 domain-containing protein [Methanoculleus sp. FWC-SCC1]|uniref:DUF4129 domain-containing protein n=1 Tax=Methanoculleus frigidifontis TaxID=2584085 RepID=A0ABT8M8S0_9EURY|nr:DUF4129 domain-containing protein [Methanoculleus sp. FWC-SCC1]MDN7024314.1 DUF4129 domain-containing protein [Methanoculleus sp. FWC-SCC1]